jgi:imidazoleglycerol phosphate synthase glutamine amidotransferase subunit HisH
LPGQGSFKSCVDALNSIDGLVDTLNEFTIINKKPLLGICVGFQMFADVGYEEIETTRFRLDFWAKYQKLIIKMENLNFLILAGMN